MSNGYRRSAVGVGATSSTRSALVLLVACSLIIGLPAFVSMAVTTCVIASDRERHWHDYAGVGAVATLFGFVGISVIVGNPLLFNYSGVVGWLGSPSLSLGALWAMLLPAMPIGVPAGAALGACVVAVGESLATGAEWHPLEQRRVAVNAAQDHAQRVALQKDVQTQDALAVPPLGVAQEGALHEWRLGGYAAVPGTLGNRGLMVIGQAGSGKTVTAERLVAALGRAGRRVVFADCKGTDPDLANRVVAAYIEGRQHSDVRVHVFPEEGLNGWTGDRADIANRLIATQDTSEPFYAATMKTAIRLAVGAPGDRRQAGCGSSGEFMARLTPESLAAGYKGTSKAAVVDALRRDAQSLRGTMLRFDGMFEAVNGGFDGSKSWGDSDVIFLRVPRLAAAEDAEAIMRMVLADFSQYCGDPKRKARLGDDITLIVDEYSAISGLAPQVIDLSERIRDVGGQVIVTAQSWEGLGRDDDERFRVRAAMAGVLLHQCSDPEKFCELAGTDRRLEQSWQLDETAHSGMGSMRMGFRMKVDPDAVRKAEVGEAWAISGGQYLHLHVIANRLGAAYEIACRLVQDSRARRCAKSPPPPPARTSRPKQASSWLDDLGSEGESDED